MRKIRLCFVAITIISIGCTNEQPVEEINTGELDTTVFLSEIKQMDSIMSSGVPQKKDIKKAIVLFQDYATHFPDDANTPSYLFQASDFYLNFGHTEKAVQLLSDIIDKYPNYNKLETVYFTRASHTDLNLRDTSLAKSYYQDFLNKYPDSQYAEDAKTRIENIGLSMEDLIKKFEEENANN